MATLVPALNACLSRMWPGEKRFARRLESKLEEDYLVWYDVPVGSSGFHPDFIVLHPLRGLLVLEVKDWRLDSIQSIDKTRVRLFTSRGSTNTVNPFEQARGYAHAIVSLLEKDPLLTVDGKLAFAWGYGVVFSNITRRQFEGTNLGEVLPPQRVICKDEMVETVDAEAFQQRLWGMFPWATRNVLTLPQIDRIRWRLFPEIRIGDGQRELFADSDTADTLPDLIRIMDLQQEQLARSLGEGHRVIHGVAGSGKTLILGYRCLHLAETLSKPILVLCYNKTLASRLQGLVDEKGLEAKITVRNFHSWCHDQHKAYHVPLPTTCGAAFYEALVQGVIEAVDRGQIPAGQYGAVLIDEGHDFAPAWLKLVVQMVDPETNNLLLLYDDAQSIYSSRRGKISFKQLGIQAQGRTTILRLNYRNTAEVLRCAYEFAKEVLTAEEADEDGIPLVLPESAERHGPQPELIRLPGLRQEADYIVQRLRALHDDGIPWSDMAIIYRSQFIAEQATAVLTAADIPFCWLQGRGKRYVPSEDTVKVVTFHSSKGLEFPVVAIPGIGFLPKSQEDQPSEVRLMYVAMTRAMDRLIMTCDRDSPFVKRLGTRAHVVAA